MGATSFGGGLMCYFQTTLVSKKQWITEEEFLTAMEMSGILPGSNTTNLTVILGNRLNGWRGAVAAFCGVCLPGGIIIFLLAAFYTRNADNPNLIAVLRGITASSIGLLLAAVLRVGGKQFSRRFDVLLILSTVILVSFVHMPLGYVLLAVIPLALWSYRPRQSEPDHPSSPPSSSP